MKIIKEEESICGHAFTLAEVLITLGIIGILATLTIPNLIKSYQKTVYVTQLKKAYTEINQALKQMAADNGCVDDLKCTGLFNAESTPKTLGDEFVKYFKVIKNCGINSGYGCYIGITNDYYDGTGASTNAYDTSEWYKFLTADGMSILVYNWGLDCNTPTWSTGRLGYMTQTCGVVVVDVNGLKKPNYYGRDTFYFYITNGKGALLYPEGGADDGQLGHDYWWKGSSYQFCNGTDKSGMFCTGRVMEEGWQMNY